MTLTHPNDTNAIPDIFVSYVADEEENEPWTYQIYFMSQSVWVGDIYIENHRWSTN